ncbi:HAD family hydrolase [Fulvivirga lutimaris]|uniref:HAD family hydrolase n=1 Tax=Fulvivirga lutimaris TaxID=1819566 RepID=UPI0012BCDA59|nr:HAD family phosphatase [Fulvivirga lutimaris]
MSQGKFKNLIFDLGGVIINLDTSLTIKAFAKLSGRSLEEVITFSEEEPSFHLYEKGQITDADFRTAIRALTSKQLDDNSIDEAWNAMILDLPIERIKLLRSLKERHNIYLLSNTNSIHMECVNDVRKKAGIESFDQLFHYDYYSHIMRKRKPDADIFEQVLQENNLDPKQTLFLDDNYDNINGASNLGINTLHVTSPNLLFEYFHER